MENNVTEYESVIALIEENPMNHGQQAPIYLSVDWENGEITAETSYDNSTPADVWYGLRSLIALPGNINAKYLKSNVDDLLPRLEEIAEGFESYYDGNNTRGRFTEEAQAELYSLLYDIDSCPESLFSLLDEGGLFDAGDWFIDPVDELTAETTDEEIEKLAEKYEMEATGDLVVIRGGSEAIADHFRYQRDKMQEEALYTVTVTVESFDGNRVVKTIKSSGFAVIGEDDKKQRIVKTQGTGARVDVPKDWLGKRVLVIKFE